MPLVEDKCPNCGAALGAPSSTGIFVCPFCGHSSHAAATLSVERLDASVAPRVDRQRTPEISPGLSVTDPDAPAPVGFATPTSMPRSLLDEIDPLGFYVDEDRSASLELRATRREGGPSLYLRAAWQVRSSLDLGGAIVADGPDVPRRWLLRVDGGYAMPLDDSVPLRCPALHVAMWPRGSILGPDPRGPPALPGVSHVLDVVPDVVAVARLARRHQELDPETAAYVRDLLAPRLVELAPISDRQLFFTVEPSGGFLMFAICIEWAMRAPTPDAPTVWCVGDVVRAIDLWTQCL